MEIVVVTHLSLHLNNLSHIHARRFLRCSWNILLIWLFSHHFCLTPIIFQFPYNFLIKNLFIHGRLQYQLPRLQYLQIVHQSGLIPHPLKQPLKLPPWKEQEESHSTPPSPTITVSNPKMATTLLLPRFP